MDDDWEKRMYQQLEESTRQGTVRVERPVRRRGDPYHFTHHAEDIHMDGCPGCEIEKLMDERDRWCDLHGIAEKRARVLDERCDHLETDRRRVEDRMSEYRDEGWRYRQVLNQIRDNPNTRREVEAQLGGILGVLDA